VFDSILDNCGTLKSNSYNCWTFLCSSMSTCSFMFVFVNTNRILSEFSTLLLLLLIDCFLYCVIIVLMFTNIFSVFLISCKVQNVIMWVMTGVESPSCFYISTRVCHLVKFKMSSCKAHISLKI